MPTFNPRRIVFAGSDAVLTNIQAWVISASDRTGAPPVSILRAIASSDLHNLVYLSDYRIVPVVTANRASLPDRGAIPRVYGGTRKPRLNVRLLAFAFYQRLQHRFEGDRSFSRAGVAVLELDPAVVEAIQHPNSGCGILHALRLE
jgi:hypothetical protein